MGQRLWNPEARLAYLLLAPALILLAIFMFYPIVYVFVMAFSKTNKLSQLTGFVGLANFLDSFEDREFWVIGGRSLCWTSSAVAVKILLGMIIALLLNVKYAGRKVARMLFIMPWASPVPISAILWRWVYHPEYGLLNYTLKATGLWANPPSGWATPCRPSSPASGWTSGWASPSWPWSSWPACRPSPRTSTSPPTWTG